MSFFLYLYQETVQKIPSAIKQSWLTLTQFIQEVKLRLKQQV